MEHRKPRLFSLYPPQSETDIVERRMLSEEPKENLSHRILVQCNKLELALQVEPIFASMALYDAKEKKKISENFHFDLNSDQTKRMLDAYVTQMDYSSQARACVFDVSQPTQDLFLVVKLEKVLQGDISESAEPYLKESANIEKVRATAYDACNRLGKYRMPFAWTAIWLQNIIKGKAEAHGDSDSDSTASNSLDRKSSAAAIEQLKRSTMPAGKDAASISLSRKGSLDRKDKRQSWAGTAGAAGATGSSGTLTSTQTNSSAEDVRAQLDNFPPVTLTVSSFFKQVCRWLITALQICF